MEDGAWGWITHLRLAESIVLAAKYAATELVDLGLAFPVVRHRIAHYAAGGCVGICVGIGVVWCIVDLGKLVNEKFTSLGDYQEAPQRTQENRHDLPARSIEDETRAHPAWTRPNRCRHLAVGP